MATLIFGLHETEVDAIADQLAVLLSWPFEKRNSSYFGDYCLHQRGERSVKVQLNRDPDGDYFEGEHPECRVLVYASLPPDEQNQFEARLRNRFPDAVLMPPRQSR